jgi:integrase
MLSLFDPSGDADDNAARQLASDNLRTAGDLVACYLVEVDGQVARREIKPGHRANIRASLAYTKSGRYWSYCDLYGRTPLGDLGQRDIAAWLARNPQWVAGDTIARHVGAVLACFAWAADEELIERSPYRKTRRLSKIRKNQRRDATTAEYCAVMDSAPEQLRRLLWFVDRAGVRTCEARELLWTDIDWAASVISRDSHKTENLLSERMPRLVGLDAETLAELRRWQEDAAGAHVFVNTRGHPWTKNALNQAFQTLRDRLGLAKDLVPYCFRHKFGTDAAMLGMNDRETAELMGHRDPRTTRRYTHLAEKRGYIRDVAAKLSGRRKT